MNSLGPTREHNQSMGNWHGAYYLRIWAEYALLYEISLDNNYIDHRPISCLSTWKPVDNGYADEDFHHIRRKMEFESWSIQYEGAYGQSSIIRILQISNR